MEGRNGRRKTRQEGKMEEREERQLEILQFQYMSILTDVVKVVVWYEGQLGTLFRITICI